MSPDAFRLYDAASALIRCINASEELKMLMEAVSNSFPYFYKLLSDLRDATGNPSDTDLVTKGEPTEFLFIGGPWDGQLKRVERPERTYVMRALKPQTRFSISDIVPLDVSTRSVVDTCAYDAHEFRLDASTRWLYIAQGMKVNEAFDTICTAYMKATPARV